MPPNTKFIIKSNHSTSLAIVNQGKKTEYSFYLKNTAFRYIKNHKILKLKKNKVKLCYFTCLSIFLDPVAKKCIDNNSGHAFGDWAAHKIDTQNAKMKKVVAATPGHEIEVAPKAVISKYKKILKPIEKDWLAEMKGKGLDGAGVLKRARQIIKKIDG